ncbi:GNAT family N-acetyltransferase [Corynebacterium cystitidis]|uniref:GNAT family N-acetyltransferase n=1 Tax=Corynebacterium cystitidis TaxID=35757 RepID=UPI00211EF2F3|nr:GNAT family protein [Corynebacterium cystitidis]
MYDFLGLGARRVRSPSTGSRHAIHPGWPEATRTAVLPNGLRIRLRPLLSSDGPAWSELRILDEHWLRPVEPTVAGTWESAHTTEAWRINFRNLRGWATKGTVVPLVIEVNGEFAGQVTIGNIQHGSVGEAWIGYWVASPFMGQGVATVACALGTDLGFSRVGLHRLTATFLPHNPASGRVLELVGYRKEGFLKGNLHIDGRWQDHYFVAQNIDDYPDSALARLVRAGRVLP